MNYCLLLPGTAELHLFRTLRIGATVVGALLLLAATPLTYRWAHRRSPGEVVGSIGAIVAAVVAAFGVSELVRRHHERRNTVVRVEKHNTTSGRFDPRYGYVLNPHQSTRVNAAGREIEEIIDLDGNRAADMNHRADPTRPTIFIAGESVGFGYGIPYEDTFGALIERETGIQVVNLSLPGFGIDQAYLRLSDTLPRFSHPVAVIVPFLPTQLTRAGDRARERPHLVVGKDEQLTLAPGQPIWQLSRLWHDQPYHSNDAFDTMRVLLPAMRTKIESVGARPLFVIFDTLYCAPGEGLNTPWMIHELFDVPQLPYVHENTANEEVLSPTDRHPNERVNRRLADTLERTLGLTRLAPTKPTGE
jgi:hypothetical protein